MCKYSYKKKNSMNKHMNMKHDDKKHNSDITEKLMKAKKKEENDKCDKTLTKEDNGKESIFQVCTIMTEYKRLGPGCTAPGLKRGLECISCLLM